jgi:hypothetical protein
MSTNIFDARTSFCSDNCWKISKDAHNQEIADYNLYPTNFTECKAPNVRMSDFSLNHVNLRGRPGYGLADDCLIDQYSALRNDPSANTQDRCHIQLFERIFQGGPRLKSATGDIDKELDILSGSDTNPFKCKKTLMETQTYNMIPLLDCLKDVQDPVHIVPQWTNGGEDTRSYVNRAEFNKNCKWNGKNNNRSI